MTELIFYWINNFNEAFQTWGILAKLICAFIMLWLFPVFLIVLMLLALPLIASLIITFFVAIFDKSNLAFSDIYINKIEGIFYLCSDIMIPIILIIGLVLNLWLKKIKKRDLTKKNK